MPRRTAKETLTDKKRKRMVEAMFIALEEGKSLAEAWLLAHPESKAKPESRRVMAQKQIAWYNEKYPSGYEQLMRRRDAQERRRQRRSENQRQRNQRRLSPAEMEQEDREAEEELRNMSPEELQKLEEESQRELEEWSKRSERKTLAADQILPAGQRPNILQRDGRYYLYHSPTDEYDLIP